MIWPKQNSYEEAADERDLPMSEEDVQRWIHIMDGLEAELADENPMALSWKPPQSVGRMPRDLRERAKRLVSAQSAAIAALQASLTEAAIELAASAPVRQSTSALYLDVMG